MLLSFYFRGKFIFSVLATTKEADFSNEATPLEEEQITLTDVGTLAEEVKAARRRNELKSAREVRRPGMKARFASSLSLINLCC